MIADRASDPSAQDALRRLEHRLEQASDAAERLVAEAAAQASARLGRTGKANVPPAGWKAAEEEDEGATRVGGDVDLVLQLLGGLRELIPAELQHRLAEALAQLLLALRALLDWSLERLEQRRQSPVEVQDIPVL